MIGGNWEMEWSSGSSSGLGFLRDAPANGFWAGRGGGFWIWPTNNEPNTSWMKEEEIWAINGGVAVEREKTPLFLCLWFSPPPTQYQIFTLEEGCDKGVQEDLWTGIPCKCAAARLWVLSFRICGYGILEFSPHAVFRGSYAGLMTFVGLGEVDGSMDIIDYRENGLFPRNFHIRWGFSSPFLLTTDSFSSSSVVLLCKLTSYAPV